MQTKKISSTASEVIQIKQHTYCQKMTPKKLFLCSLLANQRPCSKLMDSVSLKLWFTLSETTPMQHQTQYHAYISHRFAANILALHICRFNCNLSCITEYNIVHAIRSKSVRNQFKIKHACMYI